MARKSRGGWIHGETGEDLEAGENQGHPDLATSSFGVDREESLKRGHIRYMRAPMFGMVEGRADSLLRHREKISAGISERLSRGESILVDELAVKDGKLIRPRGYEISDERDHRNMWTKIEVGSK